MIATLVYNCHHYFLCCSTQLFSTFTLVSFYTINVIFLKKAKNKQKDMKKLFCKQKIKIGMYCLSKKSRPIVKFVTRHRNYADILDITLDKQTEYTFPHIPQWVKDGRIKNIFVLNTQLGIVIFSEITRQNMNSSGFLPKKKQALLVDQIGQPIRGGT